MTPPEIATAIGSALGGAVAAYLGVRKLLDHLSERKHGKASTGRHEALPYRSPPPGAHAELPVRSSSSTSGDQKLIPVIHERLRNLEEDVKELKAELRAAQGRTTMPDLSDFRDRLARLEDDLRETTLHTNDRLDAVGSRLGELRGLITRYLKEDR